MMRPTAIAASAPTQIADQLTGQHAVCHCSLTSTLRYSVISFPPCLLASCVVREQSAVSYAAVEGKGCASSANRRNASDEARRGGFVAPSRVAQEVLPGRPYAIALEAYAIALEGRWRASQARDHVLFQDEL